MNVFTTDKVRNVVLLGHGGCGKTSLIEAMAYLSGDITRMGKVTDGNTISDYDKEEVKRLFSIGSSVIPIEWGGMKINLLDTPGHYDFIGEAEEAASVADAAIIVVSGKSGIEVGTKRAWELCDRYELPRMIFVTEMDDDNASFREVVAELQEAYGKKIAPFHMPIRQNEKFVGYVNVVARNAQFWDESGKVKEGSIPDYSMENLNIYRDVLMESVAEISEEFMDRYFSGEEFSEDEIRAALKTNVIEGNMVPVTMGSSILAQGVYTLLDDIVKYFPDPAHRTCVGVNMKTNATYEANYDFSKSKSAYIFKTVVDPFIGKYSLIKVCSGVLKSDDLMYNQNQDVEEKIGKLYILRGNKPTEVKELHAGDIGALAKLSGGNTRDTLSTKAVPIIYGKTELSKPYVCQSIRAAKHGEDDKVVQGLNKLLQEDLTARIENDPANHQTLFYGIGTQQVDVLLSKLKDRYNVEAILGKPRVAFKETIRKKADVEYKYRKQSGGHGQYGHVKMIFEPSGNLEESYEFEQRVVGGAVPKNYFPAVEKGIAESVLAGPLAGYPVVGVKAVLYDGSYHAVDSSEMAFKTATVQAFKKGVLEANPVLLEPIASLKIVVPDQYTGDVMGDLSKRRSRVLGMNPIAGKKQEILADIPMTELYGYNTELRSMSGGSASFSYEFARYEQAPSDIQKQEIEAHQEEE